MPLISMKNISREMQWKLITVGIESSKALRQHGSRATYAKLKTNYPELDGTHLFALQAAIDDCYLEELHETLRHELEVYAQTLESESQ